VTPYLLVLKRKEGESLIIETPEAQKIKVALVEHCITLSVIGIDAPDGYVIYREEKPR